MQFAVCRFSGGGGCCGGGGGGPFAPHFRNMASFPQSSFGTCFGFGPQRVAGRDAPATTRG